jgi:hypothetical protein
MRLRFIIGLMTLVLLSACNKKKDEGEIVTPPPAVFLKDITIPGLPSPYYFFDYDASGKISFASHASGDRNYEVLYNGDKISEMRNNNAINKDTLRYTYDAAGKISVINYIDKNNFNYKRCFLTYNGNKLQKIEWEANLVIGFILDRTMAFTYLADGNLSEMTDHVLPVNGQTETIKTIKYEQYDDKQNTDDFILVHEGGNHMLLFPGLKLQKNNPRKVTRLNFYTIDYTYTYNDKGAVLTKTGDMLFTHGPNQGQRFQTNATHTYYPR